MSVGKRQSQRFQTLFWKKYRYPRPWAQVIVRPLLRKILRDPGVSSEEFAELLKKSTFPHSFSFPRSKDLCGAECFSSTSYHSTLFGELDSALAERNINQEPEAGKPGFHTGQP